jgi:hypothetical protein
MDLKSVTNVSKGPKGVRSYEFHLLWEGNVKDVYICEPFKNVFIAQLLKQWTEAYLQGDWTSRTATIAAASSSSASSLPQITNVNSNVPITHIITQPYISVFYEATQLYPSGEVCEH